MGEVFMNTISLEPFLQVYTPKSPVYATFDQRLNFIVTDNYGLTQVYELNGGNGRTAQITFTKEEITFIKPVNSTSNLIMGIEVAGNENQQLYLLKRGGNPILLTNSPEHIHRYGGSSPDGKWISWSSNRRNPFFFDIYIQNLETLEVHLVYCQDGIFSADKWSPDGKKLLIRKTYSSLNNDIGLLDLSTGHVNWLTGHIGEASFRDIHFNEAGDHIYLLSNKDREFFGLAIICLCTKKFTWLKLGEWDFEYLAINEDKNKLAFTINEGGISRGVLLDLNQDCLSTWETPMGVLSDLIFSPDSQKLAYVFDGPVYPPNLWELDLTTNQAEQVTYYSPSPIPEYQLIEPNLISFPSFDNLQIPTFYYTPNYAPDKLSVVVYVHGGPEGQIRAKYNPVLQYFLHLGYAVCTPNVRGSTGYGKVYTHLDDVRKRMDSVKDLVYLVKWLNETGSNDSKKIAIMGGSYGGFMVLAALSHYPHLWAAGIDIVGISSFRTFLKTTSPWRRKNREIEYGTIELDGEFFDRIDPLNHADNIIAPLMVIHGANDPRVPIEESEQMVNKLKKRNHPVTYIRFREEGHLFKKVKNKIYAYTAMAHFLETNFEKCSDTKNL